MKKQIIAGILLLATTGVFLFGQQKPLTTLFMTNPFLINPALAGTHNYFQVVSNNRFQWVGFTDSPITNTLSVYGPFVKYPMGWGASLSYDVTGPTSVMSLNGAYAYNYTLNEDMKISAGLNLGLLQYKIDISDISFENETDDNVINGTKENYYLPDATLGFYFYSSTYYAGLVASYLFNNKINIGTDPTGDSRLKTHFYLNAGYKYYINREWALEPSLVLKKVFHAPFQLDFNGRVWYKSMIWAGFSYRTQEALSILLGYVYDKKIYIGYSYDIVLNPLFSHNYGSHELMLGYRFNDIKD
jgi:type IX secretion system PorP/SprF family membrane protein